MSALARRKWREHGRASAPSSARWLIIAIGFVVAAAIFGCSTRPAPENLPPSPAPTASYSPPPSRGKLEVASWYGPGFVGHLTSDGETFNPNELTAASKTLPIGSRIRVTNTGNGRSVVVRINDRGPYVRGRSLDLSRGAAERIGLTKEGVCRVRVKVVRRTSIRRITYHERQRRPSRRSDPAR